MNNQVFTDLVKSRRSANKFIPSTPISDQELDQIFSLVKFAPSAYNLQHANYIVVREEENKQKVYEAAFKQYKILTASAVIVVLGNKKAYEDVEKLNEGMLNLGILSKQEFDREVEIVRHDYLGRGESFMRDEAIRNASLSAMQMMLIAKDQGWDTCPMIGFDAKQLSEDLHIPDEYEPVLLVAMGKEDTSRPRPRGYRKPVGEFVKFM